MTLKDPDEVQVTEQNGVNLSTPEVTAYEYNLEGNVIQQTDPNGVVDQYAYNNMNELSEETETGPGNSAIGEYLYSYRLDGLKATERDRLLARFASSTLHALAGFRGVRVVGSRETGGSERGD
jgi:YD repeat-containing protein